MLRIKFPIKSINTKKWRPSSNEKKKVASNEFGAQAVIVLQEHKMLRVSDKINQYKEK